MVNISELTDQALIELSQMDPLVYVPLAHVRDPSLWTNGRNLCYNDKEFSV